MMPSFLEKINAIQNQHQLRADYEKTLALLVALKEGTVALGDVFLTNDGWKILPVLPPFVADVTEAAIAEMQKAGEAA